MSCSKIPQEILYVQKLHFLSFLCTFTVLCSLVVGIWISKYGSLILFAVGFLLSYFITLRKQQFSVPKAEDIVHRLAASFSSRQLPPRTAAVAATQLYYLLEDSQRAEALLKAFLPSCEPLIYTTLADIYLHQRKTSEAISCLDSVRSLEHPLVHWTLGKLFLRQQDYTTGVKHLAKAQQLIKAQGLPGTSGFLNSIFMNWSVKASLFHSLAQCHYALGEHTLAKKFGRLGNLYLIYPKLWQRNYE